MSTTCANVVLRHVRRLAGQEEADALPDVQLVERFGARREPAAFAALMRRHGPMILGLCRGMLHNGHDAEDVFQATFLILARKAGSIRRPDAVGGWLYRVAYRLALRRRTGAARPEPLPPGLRDPATSDPLLDLTVRELHQALYEELDRLPERYRAPLVFCYLEGKTQDEAARQLGWTAGAVRGRLNRGRERLRARLTRRGLTLSAGLFTLAVGPGVTAAVPVSLAETTFRAGLLFAAGKAAAPSRAAALAEGGLRAMAFTQLQSAVWTLLAAVALAAGFAGVLHQTRGQTPPDVAEAASQTAGAGAEVGAKDRLDAFGDPLPAEAVSRLGTTRLRHGGPVNFLRYMPDGKTLLSQALDGIRTWDAATGKLLDAYPKETTGGGRGGSASVSADGKLLVTASESGIHLWETATAKPLRTWGKGRYRSALFSPDAKSVVALPWWRDGNQRVEMFDVTTGQEVWSWEGEPLAPACLAFTPDGKSVIAAGKSTLTSPPQKGHGLWYLDAATGKEQRRLDLGTLNAGQLALSADGTYLAALCHGEGQFLCIWDVAGGKQLHQLAPPTEEGGVRQRHFSAMTFTPDGKAVVTAGGEDGLTFWDAATGKVLRQLSQGVTNAYSLAYSPDGKTLAVGHPGATVRLLDAATGKDLLPAVTRQYGTLQAAVTPDGQTVATAVYGPVFVQWDAATGRERRRLEVNVFGSGYSLAADGRTAFTNLRQEKVLRVWDLATGKERKALSLDFGDKPLGLYAQTSDGRTLALNSYGGDTIFLMEADSGKVVRSLKDPGLKVRLVDFSADGQTLFVYCDDHTVQVWDVAAGTRRRQFGPLGDAQLRGAPVPVGGGGWDYAAKLSPDGRRIAYGSQNGDLLLFETQTGQEVCRLENLPGGGASLFAFAPDSRMLAWGSWRDPVIHLTEVATGKERHQLTGHLGPIRSLTFTADGNRLISGSADTTALVWDLTGRLAASQDWEKSLTSEELDACWTSLAGDDAAGAYQSIRRLAASPAQTLPHLAKHVPPTSPADEPRVRRLIADLSSATFGVRDNAAKELEQLGDLVVAACRTALKNELPVEVRRRLEALLEKQAQEVRNPSAARQRALRALEVLERIGTPESRRVLASLAKGAPGAWLTEEAKATLDRVAKLSELRP